MTYILSGRDRDIMRIIMDSKEPATSKVIAESYYRCESITGPSTIHSLCVSLEKRGILSFSREPSGDNKKKIMVWKVTDIGLMAMTPDSEPVKYLSDKLQIEEEKPEVKEDCQKEITMAESPMIESSTMISETNDDHKNPSGSELQVSASSEPAVVRRELHPETVRYMSGFIETLHQVEDCVNAGRFLEAKEHLEDLLGILDPTRIIVNLNLNDANAADHLLVASDLLRGSV